MIIYWTRNHWRLEELRKKLKSRKDTIVWYQALYLVISLNILYIIATSIPLWSRTISNERDLTWNINSTRKLIKLISLFEGISSCRIWSHRSLSQNHSNHLCRNFYRKISHKTADLVGILYKNSFGRFDDIQLWQKVHRENLGPLTVLTLNNDFEMDELLNSSAGILAKIN